MFGRRCLRKHGFGCWWVALGRGNIRVQTKAPWTTQGCGSYSPWRHSLAVAMEKDVTGGITRTGDEMVRTALYEAANVLLSRITRFSKLKRWGMDVAKRRGSKRAKVALARKIAVILHRIWIDGTTYRWAEAKPIAAQA